MSGTRHSCTDAVLRQVSGVRGAVRHNHFPGASDATRLPGGGVLAEVALVVWFTLFSLIAVYPDG